MGGMELNIKPNTIGGNPKNETGDPVSFLFFDS